MITAVRIKTLFYLIFISVLPQLSAQAAASQRQWPRAGAISDEARRFILDPHEESERLMCNAGCGLKTNRNHIYTPVTIEGMTQSDCTSVSTEHIKESLRRNTLNDYWHPFCGSHVFNDTGLVQNATPCALVCPFQKEIQKRFASSCQFEYGGNMHDYFLKDVRCWIAKKPAESEFKGHGSCDPESLVKDDECLK